MQIDDAVEMMKLYKGNLLQDEDYPWVSQESEHLIGTASEWFLKIAETYLSQQKYRQAIESADRVIYLSPCDESAYCILMNAYKQLGHTEYVLRTYRQLIDRLGELHIKPSSTTQLIFEGLISPEYGR